MKSKNIIITVFLITIAISSIAFLKKPKEENNLDILYWGTTCPHCHDVIDWIKENNSDEKLKIIQKEVYNDRANAEDLTKKAKICGINENGIGVPFMFTKTQKCLVGTPNITNYLSNLIKN